MKLSIGDYKSHAEMVGRFASVREGAPEPTDRVLVQFDGVLRFVAGDDDSTVIVDTGQPVEAKGKAVVASRLFLQAAKTLRGRGDVEFELDGKGGIVVKTNTGGKVVMPRVGDSIPGWVRPSSASTSALCIGVAASFWSDLSKLIALGPNKHHWPNDHVHFVAREGDLYAVWADAYRMVEACVGRAVNLTEYPYVGSAPTDFIKSLKAFEGETSINLTEDRLAVFGGASSAVTRLKVAVSEGRRAKELAVPVGLRGPTSEQFIGATVKRRDLIDNVKAVSSADKFGRVTFMVSRGETKVYGYGLEREGSMTQPASYTQGRGFVSFDSELATKLLSGITDKEITVLFPQRGSGPIQFREGKWGWRMLLAPVAR